MERWKDDPPEKDRKMEIWKDDLAGNGNDGTMEI